MSIYPRLIGYDSTAVPPADPYNVVKIPVDLFASWIGEVQNGSRTQAQMNAYFGFTAAEQTELATLMAKVSFTGGGGKLSAIELRGILEIAEYPMSPVDDTHPLGANNPYQTVAALKTRLGV